MNVNLALTIMAIPVTGGLAVTYLWAQRNKRLEIAARLARWSSQYSAPERPLTLLKKRQWFLEMGVSPTLNWFKQSLSKTGLLLALNAEGKDYLPAFIALVLALFALPVITSIAFGFDFLLALTTGLVLSVIPFVALKIKSEAVRTKFCEQLPDAIDLMVAVLRSGHSVSLAVKAVAEESPKPCGSEFETILHKMNLGQPLAQSLIVSAQRFSSYELDLIRRAVSVQAEIGGSLAELLDKTNDTLRQRLKLARQLKTITSQSRLSAQIVGLLPIVLAFALNMISPGYLQLLINDSTGRGLLMLAIALELIGIYLLRRMSTMKI